VSHCITKLTYSDTAELDAPCLQEHYPITVACWQLDVRVHVTDMVPVRWRMGNITVCVQMVGLVWTAVFASRWNAMMKLTMMKVRTGDILVSGGHQCVLSKHLWKINYTLSRQPYGRRPTFMTVSLVLGS
jgi:hypothetical protein